MLPKETHFLKSRKKKEKKGESKQRRTQACASPPAGRPLKVGGEAVLASCVQGNAPGQIGEGCDMGGEARPDARKLALHQLHTAHLAIACIGYRV